MSGLAELKMWENLRTNEQMMGTHNSMKDKIIIYREMKYFERPK